MKQDLVARYFSLPQKISPSTKDFFKWLKQQDVNAIDQRVHALHLAVFEEIDCLACANCCKTLSPAVKDSDIRRLAEYLRIKPSKLVEQYFELDDEDDYVFRSSTCPFLGTDNYCSVYEARPRACREYPHTDRRRFLQILELTKKNMAVCPAVYEVIERLKKSQSFNAK